MLTRRRRPEPQPRSPEDDSAVESGAEPTEASPPQPQRVMLPRSPSPFSLNRGWLLIVLALVAAAVGLALHNLNLLPKSVIGWLPLLVIGPAALWLLLSITRRSPKGMLGSTALLGIGLSLLLSAHNVAPLEATLMGIVLVSVGAGLLLRGLLLRGQSLT